MCEQCGEVLAESWALQEAVTDIMEDDSWIHKFRAENPDVAPESHENMVPGMIGPGGGSIASLLSGLGPAGPEAPASPAQPTEETDFAQLFGSPSAIVAATAARASPSAPALVFQPPRGTSPAAPPIAGSAGGATSMGPTLVLGSRPTGTPSKAASAPQRASEAFAADPVSPGPAFGGAATYDPQGALPFREPPRAQGLADPRSAALESPADARDPGSHAVSSSMSEPFAAPLRGPRMGGSLGLEPRPSPPEVTEVPQARIGPGSQSPLAAAAQAAAATLRSPTLETSPSPQPHPAAATLPSFPSNGGFKHPTGSALGPASSPPEASGPPAATPPGAPGDTLHGPPTLPMLTRPPRLSAAPRLPPPNGATASSRKTLWLTVALFLFVLLAGMTAAVLAIR